MNALFKLLFARRLNFILATNNSRNTPDDYVHKLREMGVNGIDARHILTSGSAAASFLKARYPAGSGIYVIGGDGLKQMLIRAGFSLSERNARAVVCGIDFELTYNKLRAATLLIRGGADFIGTNPDASFPAPEGLVPGAGSIIRLLEAASGQSPTIIGKPQPAIFAAALRQLGCAPSETLMIGDRISTDIAGAQALDIKTALLLTGVETAESSNASAVKPDAVFAGLPELLKAWGD